MTERTMPDDKDLVYGEIEGGLVFLPRHQAEELATVCAALGSARTWGEFRSLVSAQRYQQTLSQMADAIDVDSFFAEESQSDPSLSREQGVSLFRELSVGEMLPLDEDAFSGYELPWVADGDYPEWPAQEMLKWMPQEIIDRSFSKIEDSVHNGQFLVLAPTAEVEIVAALASAGFRSTKDQRLVLRSTGRAVLEVDEGAIPNLILALMSENADVRSEMIDKLAAIGEPAVPALIEALKSRNEAVRRGAASTLGEIQPVSGEALTALINAFHDESEDVCYSVSSAIATLGSEAEPAVPALMAALEHVNPRKRAGACLALGGIGPGASAAVPALMRALRDETTLWPAMSALGKIVPRFTESLRDDTDAWAEVLEADVFVNDVCAQCGTAGALFATPRMFSACPKCLAKRIQSLRARGVELPVWLHYLEGAAKGALAAEGSRADAALSVSFDDFVRCTRCGAIVLEKDARYFAPAGQAGASPYCMDCCKRLRLGQ